VILNELVSSVAVSALGAVLAFIASRAWAWYRIIRSTRLSRVAGTFIARFEHHGAEGELVIHRALTQLSQYGHEIRGIACDITNQRSWQIAGQIEKSGFLRATFETRQSDTLIRKSLLLAVEEGGDFLNGFWATREAPDLRLASGAYSMRRCQS
jgi:hypothetical protein